MLSLKAFLNERLAAVAEEIFGAVEKTIAEYKEEISLSEDLEISRLRMQLKLLKSDPLADSCPGAQQQQHSHHHQQQQQQLPLPQQQHHHSIPAVRAPESQHCEEEDGGSSVDQELPGPSQVKTEQQKSDRDFWMGHNAEQLESLNSDIKDFISSPSGLKTHLQDPIPFHNNNNSNSSSSKKNKEKPHSCPVCEKRFTNCSMLTAHARTHTGERPYRCEICRKTFITTSARNRHRTIHTKGKHCVCNYCGKSFKWMDSLSRHVRKVHKKEIVPE